MSAYVARASPTNERLYSRKWAEGRCLYRLFSITETEEGFHPLEPFPVALAADRKVALLPVGVAWNE
jgi:hypothetical protein